MTFHTNSSATDHESRLAQTLHPLDPVVYILDCGCWTDDMRFFGAILGRELILVKIAKTTSIRGQESRDSVLGDPFKKLLRTIGRIYPSGKENEKTQMSESGPSYQCEVVEHRFTRPFDWRDEKTGRVTEGDIMYVFIPDTHIGILDSEDNFACKMSPDSLVNLRLLGKVVRSAKEVGATVIQMGDFLDIWEAEAAIDVAPLKIGENQELNNGTIYFGKSKSKLTKEDFLKDWGAEPERVLRVRRAIDAIESRWKALGREEFSYITSSDTMVFIRGNHDYERFMLPAGSLQSWLPASSCKAIAGRHWSFPKSHKYLDCLWAEGHWASEHGHYHDMANNTMKFDRAQDILPGLYGKQATYWYARYQRCNSPVPIPQLYTYPVGDSSGQQFHSEPPEKLPYWSGAKGYFLSKQSRMDLVVSSMAGTDLSMFVDGYARDSADVLIEGTDIPGGGVMGFLRAAASNWRSGDNVVGAKLRDMFNEEPSYFDLRYGANGAGMVEKANFDDMRFRILDRIQTSIEQKNPHHSFLHRMPDFVDGAPRKNEFVISYSSESASQPLSVPFVVLVHGHTHQPLVIDIRFEWVDPETFKTLQQPTTIPMIL